MEATVPNRSRSDAVDERLTSCILTQRGVERPIVYKGAGRLHRDRDGALQLLVEAAPLDPFDGLMRTQNETELGQLMPEDSYYDFTGLAADGCTWTARRVGLAISATFYVTTSIRATPRAVERVTAATDDVAPPPLGQAFIPGDFASFMWVRGGRAYAGAGEGIRWQIVAQGTEGLLVETMPSGVEPSVALKRVLMALSIALGVSLSPSLEVTQDRGRTVTRFLSPLAPAWSGRIQAPFPPSHGATEQSAAFINRFLAAAGESALPRYLFERWHQVLRISANDIANSSLVLSVGVEAIVMKAFAPRLPADTEWERMVADARTFIRNTPLTNRVITRLTESLAMALKPTCIAVLRHLLQQGVVTMMQIDAWKRLRHPAAHGDGLPDDDVGFQEHLDTYFTSLGLFYALIGHSVGYDDGMVDFSQKGWPSTS